ncbi:MAG: hypothetical protein LBF66_02220 [Holosporales bacterium]|nr:hypothetical protein [Holosporales bacterium]
MATPLPGYFIICMAVQLRKAESSIHIPSDVPGFLRAQRLVKRQKSTRRVSRGPYG